MFGLRTQRRNSTLRASSRWATLGLESLEARDNPSSITLNIGYGSAPQAVILSGHVTDSNPAGLEVDFNGVASGSTTTNANGDYQTTLTASGLGDITAQVAGTEGNPGSTTAAVLDTAPVISNLTATTSGNHTWTLSGSVTAAAAQGLTVTFGAAESLNGQTTSVNADGAFSLTYQMSGAGDAGGVTAQVQSDWFGAASNLASTAIAWLQTGITLNIQYGSGHTVILSGNVADDNASGLTVNFSGVVSGQTTTDASGNYLVSLTASALGNITAQVSGSAGQVASAVSTVANVAPTISNFQVVAFGTNSYTVSGVVSDEYDTGLVVTLGSGIPGLNGQTVNVSSNGSFSYTFQTTTSGTVSAQIMSDWWGAASNVSLANVLVNKKKF